MRTPAGFTGIVATLIVGAWAAFVTPLRADEGTRGAPPPAVDVAPSGSALQTTVFAGGCFWGIQGVFQHVKGVTEAVSGYAGGTVADPDYEQVSAGDTGHAESVRVTFDPAQVSYGQLLQVFFSVALDPTQANRQGSDWGTRYRSDLLPVTVAANLGG
jgi:peptide-methionine (S)-S-oxide reductase